MADLKDIVGKNREFTGTKGIKTSNDGLGTGDRTDEKGRLRFNDTSDLLEYYTGTEWKSIDAPPTISSFSVSGRTASTSQYVSEEGDSSNVAITINGSLFSSGATLQFIGTGGGDVTADTVTFVNSNQLTAVVNDGTSFDSTYEPWDVKVINPSGLFAQIADGLTVDNKPVFTNAENTTFEMGDAARSDGITANQLCGATDPEGDTITYSVLSGSLPTGLSLNSSTGAITGTAAEESSTTTYTFTVVAASNSNTSQRTFKITVVAPVIETFTSPGTFSVPADVTAVDVLVVAGGGGGGVNNGGAGGAGGLIFRPGFTVSPGGSVSVTIGGGGTGYYSGQPESGQPGQDSVFGTLTAKGGGGGGGGGPTNVGQPGGSGGGAGSSGTPGGSATQPGQPGDSGTYGFGNAGGLANDAGGGGGGAGGAGGNGIPGGGGGAGGIGKAYSISGSSVYYAGGGGGAGGDAQPWIRGLGGQGGGGNGANQQPSGGQNGTANRGGGGGGAENVLNPDGAGDGGSGIVIVRY